LGWDNSRKALGMSFPEMVNGKAATYVVEEGEPVDDRTPGEGSDLTPTQLVQALDDRHDNLIEWASAEGESTTFKAKLFPSVIPIWTHFPKDNGIPAPSGSDFPAVALMDAIRQKGAVALLRIKPNDYYLCTECSTPEQVRKRAHYEYRHETWRDGDHDTQAEAFGKEMGEWMLNGNSTGDDDKGNVKRNEIAVSFGAEVAMDWAHWADAPGNTDEGACTCDGGTGKTYVPPAVGAGNTAQLYRKAFRALRTALRAGVGQAASDASLGSSATEALKDNIKMVLHYGIQRGTDTGWNGHNPASDSGFAHVVDIFGFSLYDHMDGSKNIIEMVDPTKNKSIDAGIEWAQSADGSNPVWLIEWGTLHLGGDEYSRGQWLKNGLEDIWNEQAEYRRVKVFCYFDLDLSKPDKSPGDWRILGSDWPEPPATPSGLRARYSDKARDWRYRPTDSDLDKLFYRP